jgi:glutathione S-transferase
MATMKLFSFWRSQAALRVRIPLGLKHLQAEAVYVDLFKDEQLQPDYGKLNPAMLLPTLIDGDGEPLGHKPIKGIPTGIAM